MLSKTGIFTGPAPRNVRSHPIVPSRLCERCGEWLPHWCAPVIVITRARWTGRRMVTITDRMPES